MRIKVHEKEKRKRFFSTFNFYLQFWNFLNLFLYIFNVVVDINTDLEKKIIDAFLIFDHQGNKTVDVREVGTILRYLGCVPSENEINEIVSMTESEDSNGTVHLSRFLPLVSQLLAEHKYILSNLLHHFFLFYYFCWCCVPVLISQSN